MPEPEEASTSFSGSWCRVRKKRSGKVRLRWPASRSILASSAPSAISAHVWSNDGFQLIIRSRGLAGSRASLISAAVGNSSLPRW
ncbi:hypothetical protein ACFQ0B_18555 [Nonomuraea thailandensis]